MIGRETINYVNRKYAMNTENQKKNYPVRSLDDRVGAFTVSIQFDHRLYRHDIAASKAHVAMLSKQGIILPDECQCIIEGLDEIESEIQDGDFQWKPELEYIHMHIENRLHEKIGSVAGKLHTARSRNDQVSVGMRMYVKDSVCRVLTAINSLQLALVQRGELYREVIFPGFTHLQKAQPVLFAHHLLAYAEMLERDKRRFEECYHRTNILPLGSGALAGVPYPIDREFVAGELGFSSISSNSMDAVSDRDFVIDYISAAAIIAMHISRLAEELIIWTTEEFSFVALPVEYTTGSSIMPQKRNPDFAEISRGKSGRIYGHLMSILTVMKSLPLTYNRDLQEDKESFFDTEDTLLGTLEVFSGMVSGLTVNRHLTEKAAEGGLSLATDVADYLVAKGVPFRQSHSIVSQLSDYAIENKKTFGEFTLSEYKRFSELFAEDVMNINLQNSVESRDVFGGTAPSRVSSALVDMRNRVEGYSFE